MQLQHLIEKLKIVTELPENEKRELLLNFGYEGLTYEDEDLEKLRDKLLKELEG